LESINIYRFN